LLLQVLPRFKVSFAPDFRDDIARTWPESVDDAAARHDWGWQHRYDLQVGGAPAGLTTIGWTAAAGGPAADRPAC
jgi:hypothetical protein